MIAKFILHFDRDWMLMQTTWKDGKMIASNIWAKGDFDRISSIMRRDGYRISHISYSTSESKGVISYDY